LIIVSPLQEGIYANQKSELPKVKCSVKLLGYTTNTSGLF